MKYIAHVGIGNFHRSHQETYLTELGEDWRYIGIGMLYGDVPIRDSLKDNSWRYDVTSWDENGVSTTMTINTLSDYILANEDVTHTLNILARPDVHIVSLTITENGYSESLTIDDVSLIYSCLMEGIPAKVKSVSTFGLLLSGLALRYYRKMRPYTIMSCDNMLNNGKIVKEKCKLSDNVFQRWIDTECRFPSTVVDRITPQNSHPRDVICESYKSWVIEDSFVDGIRPSWEKVGVIITDDVTSYELRKLCILNGTHSYIGYLGSLKGYHYIHETLWDPEIYKKVQGFMNEIIPRVQEIISQDCWDYGKIILKRFQNEKIFDTVERIMQDSMYKIEQQIIPIYKSNMPITTEWLINTGLILPKPPGV